MPSPLRTTSLGICMDLNPQPPTLWTLAEGPYELADHCISKKTNVLIMLNSWLDSDTEPEEKHDWHTLNYWAARLRPLWVNEATDEDNADEYGVSEAPSDAPDSGDETIVIICNRSGEENGKKTPDLENQTNAQQARHLRGVLPCSACGEILVGPNCWT